MAIKVIDKKKARQDSYVLKNMKREPRIHQMVRHPHIVVLLEVNGEESMHPKITMQTNDKTPVGLTSLCLFQTLETENSYYMAMELCTGGDLMDRICEKKRLEEREVRRYVRQILSAVDHLHKYGIVHRLDYSLLAIAFWAAFGVFRVVRGIICGYLRPWPYLCTVAVACWGQAHTHA